MHLKVFSEFVHHCDYIRILKIINRGHMLSQMPRSFTTRFQFVPTCEQTFWGYSQLGTNFDKVIYRQTRVGDKLGTNFLYRYQQKCLLAFHSQLNLYSVYLLLLFTMFHSGKQHILLRHNIITRRNDESRSDF